MARLAWWHRSLLRLAFLIALAVPCISSAQDWVDEGSITSRQCQRQIREGNQIVAVETTPEDVLPRRVERRE